MAQDGGGEDADTSVNADAQVQPPDADAKIQPPDADVEIQPPDTDAKIQPPDTDAKIQPPDAGVEIRPPDADATVQSPDADAKNQPSDADAKIQPSDADAEIRPPDADATLQSPDADAEIRPPDADAMLQSPDADMKIQSLETQGETQPPVVDAKTPSLEVEAKAQSPDADEKIQLTCSDKIQMDSPHCAAVSYNTEQELASVLTDALQVVSCDIGFLGYLVITFVGCALVAILVFSLWSAAGHGPKLLAELAKAQEGAYRCALILVVSGKILYVLDFFWPPHLPGRYCVLEFRGYQLRNPILGFLTTVLVVMGFLMAKRHVWAPALLTTFMCPAYVFFVRVWMKPRVVFNLDERFVADVTKRFGADFLQEAQRVVELKEMQGDRNRFYGALVTSLCSVAGINFFIWYDWHKDTGQELFPSSDAVLEGREEFFILWCAPLIVTVAYVKLAALSSLHLVFSANKVQKGAMHDAMSSEALAPAPSHPPEQGGSPRRRLAQTVRNVKLHFPMHHQNAVRQLTGVLKCMLHALVGLMGMVWVAYVLMSSPLLLMVQAWLLLTLLTAAGFVYLTYNGLWVSVWASFVQLPILTAIVELLYTDWGRAIALFCCFPAVPAVLCVSMLNQFVRQQRGLYNKPDEKDETQAKFTSPARRSMRMSVQQLVDVDNPKNMLITPRIHQIFVQAWKLDPCDVLEKLSILAIVGIALSLTSVFLNVLLAWFIFLLKDLALFWVIVCVWILGLILFLLPPVPGAPVYLFGGVLISGKGATDWGSDTGFWIATCICIGVCFVLKLSACAVQQKGIGERLGARLWVRQHVGVHKPFIRAIEHVLEQPGLSFGKVVILVGGPDWPTSVLAGVLRLSLCQCLLGTFPIIVYIAPLTLTGSFYFKRSAGAMWRNAGDLMFTLTAVITIVLWVSIWWVIQNELEKESKRLRRPMKKFVELEWLDKKEEIVRKVCIVTWREVPFAIRVALVFGSVTMVLVFHSFYWLGEWCFNSFDVTDDISTFHLYGLETSVILSFGMFGLLINLMGIQACVVFFVWRRRKIADRRMAAQQEADEQEKDWKEKRYEEAEQAEREWEAEDRPQPEQKSGEATADSTIESKVEAAAEAPDATDPAAVAIKVEGQTQRSDGAKVLENSDRASKGSSGKRRLKTGGRTSVESEAFSELASQGELASAKGIDVPEGKKKTATKKKKPVKRTTAAGTGASNPPKKSAASLKTAG